MSDDEDFGDGGSPAADNDNFDDLEDEDADEAVVDIGEPTGQGKPIPKNERTTSRFMTKYERARVLGVRALQISMNAPVLVDLGNHFLFSFSNCSFNSCSCFSILLCYFLEPTDTDPLQIAMKELRQNRIPIIVRRYLPHGDYEDWAVDELIVEHT